MIILESFFKIAYLSSKVREKDKNHLVNDL